MAALKELTGKIETKKFRIQCSVNWLKDNNSSLSTIEATEKDILNWLKDLDNLFDQIIFKSPEEERLTFCNDAVSFSSSIRETLLELKAGRESGKNLKPVSLQPLKLELECPNFSGSPSADKFEFRTFLRRFEFCTTNLGNADRMLILKSKLKGKAFDLISNLDVSSENYTFALDCLKQKFLNPSLIKDRIFEEIIPQPVQITKLDELKTCVEQVKLDLSELDKSFGTDFFSENSTSGSMVAHILFRKFPVNVRRELMSRTKERYPSFMSIMSNIFDIIEFLQAAPLVDKRREGGPLKPQFSASSSPEHRPILAGHKNSNQKRGMNPSIPRSSVSESKKFCKLCELPDHTVKDCSKYPSHEMKVRRAKDLRLCSRCLGGHSDQDCKGNRGFPYPCNTCGLKTHYTVMCPKTPKSFVGRNTLSDMGNCIFPVIKVSMKGKRRLVSFHCILDSGSQKSFFSRSVLRKLCSREKLVPKPVIMPVNTLIGTRSVDLLELSVSIKLGSQKPFPFSALFADNLNLKFQVPRFDEITSNIKEAGFRLGNGYEDLNGTDLHGLVGLDLIQQLKDLHLVECLNGTAWRISDEIIPFGNGHHFLKPVTNKEVKQEYPPFDQIVRSLPKCSSFLIDSALNPVYSYSDALGPFFEDSSVERGIEHFLSLESIGIDESKNLSSYDEEKIADFEKSIVLKNGRYYVDLPWDGDKLSRVDSNYVPSLKIMHRVADSLEKKGLYEEYLQVFREYEDCGIVEPFSVPPGEFKNYCWIPHRPVIKEGLGVTTKIRPVFNCSLKRRGGVSINDAAYAGVNLTAQLLDLLLVFRKNNYVLLGDLRKAFLQIRLRTVQDKNRFCFFLKVKDKLYTYRYNSIIFGFNASPFILGCILKFHAERYGSDTSSSVISNNFYVDNLVTTSCDSESLLYVYNTVRNRLKDAGFDLQSCNSNCADLQNKMLEDGSVTSPPPSYEKVLGYRYSPRQDTIRLAPTNIDIKVDTKRGILSQTSSIYDPLSLLLPVTIQGKTFVSQLWKNNLSWDQQIPEKFRVLWQTLAKELNKISEFEFTRRVLQESSPVEFICFCDASKLAYGFSLYAKQGNRCSLLFAKAKVAPIKQKTLPTLELMAIYLALKVVPKVIEALKPINILSIFFVSDAQVALSWVLNGKGSKRNIFVENRVLDIKKSLDDVNLRFGVSPLFRYVPSSENPADLLTRGISASKFEQLFDFWVYGPDWLNQHTIVWPVSPLPCLNDTNRKIVSCMLTEDSRAKETSLPIDISKFSSLSRAINVLEKVLRFGDKLMHRHTDTHLRAKLLLFSDMQREAFPFELEYLTQPSDKVAPPRTTALGLFIDKDGLLRTKGRIQNSSIHPFGVKFPILLGKHHPLTELVIKEAHLNCCHMGTNSTLSKLRLSGFWIPQGRQSVKKTLRSCITCKKINSLPYKAPSGSQLPSHRANFVHPFQQVGIDFTGQFLVKYKDDEIKMYILLFTCMSLRAVHLELLPDMSSRSFLLAFVRFTNLFGVPTHVYSDNAKTFLASGIMLSEIFVSDEFKEHFRSASIRHLTIPLYSAWHGGAWERMIGTMKQCLKKLIGRRKIQYFEFLTVISDVQKAINDRPLTYITASEGGLDILTPNHFLQTGYNPRLLISSYGSEDLCPDAPSRTKLVQSLELRHKYVEKFRKMWHNDYLLSLRERDTNLRGDCPLKVSVGEIVLIKSPNKTRPFWSLGKVLRLITGNDGKVRSACVLRDGCEQIHSLKHLFPLELKGVSASSSATFQEEGGPFFCPSCSVANDGSSPMVCCDACDNWYHFDCVGVVQQDTSGEWICPNCSDKASH